MGARNFGEFRISRRFEERAASDIEVLAGTFPVTHDKSGTDNGCGLERSATIGSATHNLVIMSNGTWAITDEIAGSTRLFVVTELFT
jgi:hypothetical protein